MSFNITYVNSLLLKLYIYLEQLYFHLSAISLSATAGQN